MSYIKSFCYKRLFCVSNKEMDKIVKEQIMKIVIYGINQDTIEIINSIKDSNNIVAISDSFENRKALYGYPFLKAEELHNKRFDYIIVCVKMRKTFEEIKEKLSNLNISKERILSFQNLYYESRVDQVMLKAKIQNKIFDGLIMGISHAAYAINPKYLKGNWANVAVPSEDIINHNFIFDKLISNYYKQISNVKRIIIDLYDYSVMNFITNNSRYKIEFYSSYCGDGIEYQEEFEDLENKIRNENSYSSNYARDYRELRQKIFDDEKVFIKYANNNINIPTPINYFFKECVCCENEIEVLDKGIEFIPKIQHDDNIFVNTEQLSILIDKIYKFNSNVKLYFVLIPRIAEIEKKLDLEMINYKKTLFKVVENLTKKYPKIKVLDYKGINEISLYTEGYCSVGHMNIKGQKAFTEKLNKDIFEGE